jgi:hypothetical protein
MLRVQCRVIAFETDVTYHQTVDWQNTQRLSKRFVFAKHIYIYIYIYVYIYFDVVSVTE